MVTRPQNRKSKTHLMNAIKSPEPQVVAILNLTPDSFSDGGQWANLDALLDYANQLWQAGVTWWDVGAESTRPGSQGITAETEIQRLMTPLTQLRQTFPQAVISVDTRKAAVAQAALELDINWINDVSGLTFDPVMPAVIARYGAGLMLMHSQGLPETMQLNPTYTHVLDDVTLFLQRQIAIAKNAGIVSIVIDPGFGFGKTLTHNLTLFRALPQLFSRFAPIPLMVGTSRKKFLTLEQPIPVDLRDGLTATTTALAYQAGVRFFRVHNALEAQHQLRLLTALNPIV